MRRLIGYTSMALTLLVASGVAFSPVFSKMNQGREFKTGNEIVYKLSDKEGATTDLENDAKAAEQVAEEMRARLDVYKIEDYSVRVEGNDQIRVSLAVSDENQLNHISKYLSFSGNNFSLATNGEKEVESRLTQDKIFVDSEAYIYRVEDVIPYVIFPISDVSAVNTLIESLSTSEDDSDAKFDINRAGSDDSGDGEQAKQADIFLWANWEEGDLFEDREKDPHVGQKLIASFVHDEIWFKEKLKDGEDPHEIMFLPTPDMTDKYDTAKLKQANEEAQYIVNLFNASEYKYEVTNLFTKETATSITNVSIRSDATAEALVKDSKVVITATLVATLVAIVVVSLILGMFFKVGTLGIVANTVTSVFLTFALFMAIGATMNIAAIVGGVLLAISSTAIGILYMHKLKEEVYKGRSLRKSHQEATKKILLPTIDVNVISAFAGLMIYFLGGNALKSLGIVLFFGALVSLVMTLLVFRIMMWLLTNSTKMQDSYKSLNIDENLVPNVMKEEKPTYVAPYETKDFTKKRKPVAIVSLILAAASVAAIATFGAIKGSPLNVSRNEQESTLVYLAVKSDNPVISTEDEFKAEVLNKIQTSDGKSIAYTNVEVLEKSTYDAESTITTNYIYFVTTYETTFAESDRFIIKDEDAIYETYSEAAIKLVAAHEGESSEDYITCEEKVTRETVVAPNQGFVALASAIAIIGSALYFAFRFRPSRGIAALIVSTLTTTLTYGLFVLARIQTTAICSIIMPIATVLSLVACVFFFEKEKELIKEQKEELTPELRNNLMVKASSLAAAPLFITAIISAYIGINYFAFGSINFSAIFAGLLIAVVLSVLLVTTLLGPTSEIFAKWLRGIKLPTIKINRSKKHQLKMQAKQKTSEPEETVFIGIND